MAHLTPDEVLEQFGSHHNLQPETTCAFLCNEFQTAEDIYQSLPPGPAKVAAEKRIVAIAQQIKLNHCRCLLQ